MKLLCSLHFHDIIQYILYGCVNYNEVRMTWKIEKCTIIFAHCIVHPFNIVTQQKLKKSVIITVKFGLHEDTEATRKQIVTFILRWLLSGTIFPYRSDYNTPSYIVI